MLQALQARREKCTTNAKKGKIPNTKKRGRGKQCQRLSTCIHFLSGGAAPSNDPRTAPGALHFYSQRARLPRNHAIPRQNCSATTRANFANSARTEWLSDGNSKMSANSIEGGESISKMLQLFCKQHRNIKQKEENNNQSRNAKKDCFKHQTTKAKPTAEISKCCENQLNHKFQLQNPTATKHQHICPNNEQC